MCVQIVNTTLHGFYSYLLITYLGLGVVGAAYASTITAFSNVIVIHLYVTFFVPEVKEAWILPGKESFLDLGGYIKVAFPSMLLMCNKYWAFEIQTLIATRISVDAIGA